VQIALDVRGAGNDKLSELVERELHCALVVIWKGRVWKENDRRGAQRHIR